MISDFPRRFYVCIALHVLIAVPMAWYLNIWSDEASTLYTTGDGFLVAFERAAHEKQAPLYFLLLSIWRLVSDSIFFARLFSVLCSVVSIAAFYKLVSKIWKPDIAFVATILFSLHPYLIWASGEVRVYALIILFSLLLLNMFEEGFLRYRRSNIKARHAFTVLSILAFCTNYYFGFFLFGLFVSLLVVKHFRAAFDYLVRMGVVLIILIPVFLMIRNHLGSDLDGQVFEPNLIEGIKRLWHHTLFFVLPTEIYPPEDQTMMSYVRLWIMRIVILLVAGLMIVKRKVPQRLTLFFGTQVFVICGFLFLVSYAVGLLYVELRHAAVLFVPMSLLLISLILEFRKVSRWKRKYFGFIVVLLASFYIYGIQALYPEHVKRGDWTRVSEFVEKNEKSGQPVIVFRTYEALAFRQSYNGQNRVYPDHDYSDWFYEGEYGSEQMWPKQQRFVISQIPKDSSEVWLLTEDVCQQTNACSILEKFISENYTVVTQKDFYKERVRLLRKK